MSIGTLALALALATNTPPVAAGLGAHGRRDRYLEAPWPRALVLDALTFGP